ncbi:hypothetical protein IV203_004486 [Nitzschia inconspicua]|uniref:Uncharacterized protein n=1 Tax=Nitzschia inconspicua TaxID=303405 RepID=A0A9K3L3W4_9STRA|nr:hypothetical protein IV203_004486 [Nitzschia inconspicua]
MEQGDETTGKVGDGLLPTMGASTANRKTLPTKEAVEATPGNASNSSTELEVSSVKAPSPTKGETASVKTSDLAASSVAAETDSKQDTLKSKTTSLQPTSTVGTKELTTTKIPSAISTKADENDSRSVPPQEETSSNAKHLDTSSTITSTTTAEKAEPTKLPSPKEIEMGLPTTSTTIATTLKTSQTVTKSTVSLQKSPSTDTSIEQPSNQSTTMDRNSLETGSRTSAPVSRTTLSAATTPTGGAARPAANLNPEEAVKVMVNNIITLLETRGPLTMGQLEYNLPPLHLEKIPLFGMDVSGGSNDESGDGSIVNTAATGDAISDAPTDSKVVDVDDKSSSPLKGSDASSPRYKKLIPGNDVPDIVELLVALGVIQQEDIQTSISSGEGQKIEDGSPQQGPREPRYAIAGGRPRQFVVTPSNVLAETAKAYDEIDASLKRQEMLREALDPATSDKRAAQILEQIAMQYPQAVADDPVYLTALRNMHIDVVAVLGRHKNIQGTSGGAVTGGASVGAGGGERSSAKKRASNQQGKIQGTKRGRDAGTVGGSNKRPKKSKTLVVQTTHKSVEPGNDPEGKAATNVGHSETTTSVGKASKTPTAGIAIQETKPNVTIASSHAATQSAPAGTTSETEKAATTS